MVVTHIQYNHSYIILTHDIIKVCIIIILARGTLYPELDKSNGFLSRDSATVLAKVKVGHLVGKFSHVSLIRLSGYGDMKAGDQRNAWAEHCFGPFFIAQARRTLTDYTSVKASPSFYPANRNHMQCMPSI